MKPPIETTDRAAHLAKPRTPPPITDERPPVPPCVVQVTDPKRPEGLRYWQEVMDEVGSQRWEDLQARDQLATS